MLVTRLKLSTVQRLSQLFIVLWYAEVTSVLLLSAIHQRSHAKTPGYAVLLYSERICSNVVHCPKSRSLSFDPAVTLD